jgi:thioredoxin 1
MSEVTFTDLNFQEEAAKHKGLVLVDFFASWCGPCRMMAPTIEKLAKDYEGKVKIGKLNVDDNPETSMNFQIQSIPTLVFFKNGEMVQKLIGFQSEENIKKTIDSLM